MDAVLRRCGTSVTPLPSQGSRSHFQRVPSYTTPCPLRVHPRCGFHRRERPGASAIFPALPTSQNKKNGHPRIRLRKHLRSWSPVSEGRRSLASYKFESGRVLGQSKNKSIVHHWTTRALRYQHQEMWALIEVVLRPLLLHIPHGRRVVGIQTQRIGRPGTSAERPRHLARK